MQLERYQKTRDLRGRAQTETCDSGGFVAFWSDHKYVSARDRDGTEWLLKHGTVLRDIEAGDEGLMRIHQSRLVRRDSVDELLRIRYRNSIDGFGVARVLGHEYRFSRDHWRKLIRQRLLESASKVQVQMR
ncbi:hypothetical protein J2X66_005872 [Pseudomonas sp. 3296]|jgi:hypothetical protein|uniref:hypothetical protein n=1 Tax=Pseudomonas sp. 3296 TaxID=2817753 RepID=UPI0028595BBC|nr:hypothetical protein [Pseudomonas sp. 3296]MDR6918967.1 hypothetical protein [Pseudomonas sp. 3296]